MRPCIDFVFILLTCSVLWLVKIQGWKYYSVKIFKALLSSLSLGFIVAIQGNWVPFLLVFLCVCLVVFSSFFETYTIILCVLKLYENVWQCVSFLFIVPGFQSLESFFNNVKFCITSLIISYFLSSLWNTCYLGCIRPLRLVLFFLFQLFHLILSGAVYWLFSNLFFFFNFNQHFKFLRPPFLIRILVYFIHTSSFHFGAYTWLFTKAFLVLAVLLMSLCVFAISCCLFGSFP